MKWYERSTGNHQGLVIDEDTGESIAAVYDKANARLIAAAPDLLAALRGAVEALESCYDVCDYPASGDTVQDEAAQRARDAIAKATNS